MKTGHLVILLFLSIFLVAAEKAERKPAGAFEHVGSALDEGIEKTREFFTDSAITARVTKRLAKDEYVSVIDFRISTNEGIVTVTGEAQNEQIAQRVVDIARATKGARGVDNKILIISKAPSQAR